MTANRFEEREAPIRRVVSAMRDPASEKEIAANLPEFDSRWPDHGFQSALNLRVQMARDREEIGWMQCDWGRGYVAWLVGRVDELSLLDGYVKLEEKYAVAEIVLATAEHILDVLALRAQEQFSLPYREPPKFTRDDFYAAAREQIGAAA